MSLTSITAVLELVIVIAKNPEVDFAQLINRFDQVLVAGNPRLGMRPLALIEKNRLCLVAIPV